MEEDYPFFADHSCQLILLDGWSDQYAFDSVLIANTDSAHYATRYLIERGHGIKATVVDMFCVKPLDTDAIKKAARNAKAVITAEEHSPFGGLGSMVSQVVGASCPKLTYNITLPDTPVITGTSQEVFKYYGMDANGIASKAVELLKNV